MSQTENMDMIPAEAVEAAFDSAERNELTRIIMSPESFDGGPASCGPNDVYAGRIAEAILDAGYSKCGPK